MSQDFDFAHLPVLFRESIDSLSIKKEGIYVDCTAGGGGHSQGILEKLGKKGLLLSLDKDDEALLTCEKKREENKKKDQWKIIKADFSDISTVLKKEGVEKVDGILADLGVSSYQLDTPERGFSYAKDGPLDMRMDKSAALTAEEVINRYSEKELADIFRQYGEEKFAGRIARVIVEKRRQRLFSTTKELADAVLFALPAKARNEAQHPARRVFQAVRIEVNHELRAVDILLDSALEVLKEGGRLSIISFHSLEDRRVKEAFREWENPCVCPRNFPICVCGREKKGKVITRKAMEASLEEIKENTRSRSAKLRVFERGE